MLDTIGAASHVPTNPRRYLSFTTSAEGTILGPRVPAAQSCPSKRHPEALASKRWSGHVASRRCCASAASFTCRAQLSKPPIWCRWERHGKPASNKQDLATLSQRNAKKAPPLPPNWATLQFGTQELPPQHHRLAPGHHRICARMRSEVKRPNPIKLPKREASTSAPVSPRPQAEMSSSSPLRTTYASQ